MPHLLDADRARRDEHAIRRRFPDQLAQLPDRADDRDGAVRRRRGVGRDESDGEEPDTLPAHDPGEVTGLVVRADDQRPEREPPLAPRPPRVVVPQPPGGEREHEREEPRHRDPEAGERRAGPEGQEAEPHDAQGHREQDPAELLRGGELVRAIEAEGAEDAQHDERGEGQDPEEVPARHREPEADLVGNHQGQHDGQGVSRGHCQIEALVLLPGTAAGWADLGRSRQEDRLDGGADGCGLL